MIKVTHQAQPVVDIHGYFNGIILLFGARKIDSPCQVETALEILKENCILCVAQTLYMVIWSPSPEQDIQFTQLQTQTAQLGTWVSPGISREK